MTAVASSSSSQLASPSGPQSSNEEQPTFFSLAQQAPSFFSSLPPSFFASLFAQQMPPAVAPSLNQIQQAVSLQQNQQQQQLQQPSQQLQEPSPSTSTQHHQQELQIQQYQQQSFSNRALSPSPKTYRDLGPAVFERTNRGYTVLRYEGYSFSKISDNRSKTYWRCANRTCRAKVHTSDGRIIYVGREPHVHLPRQVCPQSCASSSKVRNTIKSMNCQPFDKLYLAPLDLRPTKCEDGNSEESLEKPLNVLDDGSVTEEDESSPHLEKKDFTRTPSPPSTVSTPTTKSTISANKQMMTSPNVRVLPSSPSEIELFRLLQRANLLGYYDIFVSRGGDDVQQLVDANEDEFGDILRLVGMSSKPLHVRRLQKVLAEWSNSPEIFRQPLTSSELCSAITSNNILPVQKVGSKVAQVAPNNNLMVPSTTISEPSAPMNLSISQSGYPAGTSSSSSGSPCARIVSVSPSLSNPHPCIRDNTKDESDSETRSSFNDSEHSTENHVKITKEFQFSIINTASDLISHHPDLEKLSFAPTSDNLHVAQILKLPRDQPCYIQNVRKAVNSCFPRKSTLHEQAVNEAAIALSLLHPVLLVHQPQLENLAKEVIRKCSNDLLTPSTSFVSPSPPNGLTGKRKRLGDSKVMPVKVSRTDETSTECATVAAQLAKQFGFSEIADEMKKEQDEQKNNDNSQKQLEDHQ